MTSPAASAEAVLPDRRFRALLPSLFAGLAFAVLFYRPAALLVRDWWTNPEAGHGLLLFPVAMWLAWKRGWAVDSRPNPALGIVVLIAAVLLRAVSELAAELFTMRFSMVAAAIGLIVFHRGLRQVWAWWLPCVLVILSIPLPELITSALALPLQFRASRMGAALLEWRQIPVRLSGNVLEIPGHRLFVTEACSGLRSLTALLSIAFLLGGLWLDRIWTRGALVAAAIGIAVVINGVRVFLTGFLVYFVDPKLGEGFLHLTEGWLLFLVSLVLIAGVTKLLAFWNRPPGEPHAV